MKITKKFFKNIPIEKRAIAEERLRDFVKLIPSSKSLSEIPKGFWIRKIAGTDIYKFRVNSGDRILFKYDDNNEICFLSFQTHDNQIRSAQTKQSYISEDFILVTEEYIENDLDNYVDHHVRYELQAKLSELRHDIIVKNEDISLIIEDSLFKNDNFLTSEQFEILSRHDDISIVLGCAGSGKTNVGIRKLLINQDLDKETIYLTHSKFLTNEIKREFNNISDTKKNTNFYSLQYFYEKLLKKEFKVIYYPDFIDWLIQNNLHNSYLKITPLNIFLEINTVLKGSSFNQKIITNSDYLNLDSYFNNHEKKHIYYIASLYEKWLIDNEYCDLNDLAKKISGIKPLKTDFVLDEVQDFTQVQMHSILKLKHHNQSIILFGDSFQSIQNYTFSLEQLKKIFREYQYKFHVTYLSKNFRSGNKIVNLLNKVKQEKQSYQISSAYLQENSVRTSPKPEILISEEDFKILNKNINQNADTILVVSSQQDKQKLLNNGFNKIFDIHDLPGLQYSNIYCYNLLNNFNKSFETLKKNHTAQFNSILFNFIYLSSSRALNKLVFIESKNSTLSKSFEEYIENTNLDKLIADESSISTINDWNRDGYYLKRLGKYKQAIQSFKQANNKEEINICKKLIERTLNYEFLAMYELVIKFDWDVNNVAEIENALIYLKYKYNWDIRGNIKHYVTQIDGLIYRKQYFIHEDQIIYKLANEITKNTNHGAADKKNIFFTGCIYHGNTPIKINSDYNSKNQDVYIKYVNNKYSVTYEYAQPEHTYIKQVEKNISEKILGKSDSYLKFNREAQLEKDNSGKSAEDHLSDIFG